MNEMIVKRNKGYYRREQAKSNYLKNTTFEISIIRGIV